VLPTVPRELRAELAHRPDLTALAEREIPTLLLVGSESPPWAVSSVAAHAEALPDAETHTLEGHGHGANVTGPELLAAELRRFLLGS
jgi:pimeloyl-ACP methyl ester carboxylesterase